MGKYTFFGGRYYRQSNGFGQNAPRKCRAIEIYDCGFLQYVRLLQKGGGIRMCVYLLLPLRPRN